MHRYVSVEVEVGDVEFLLQHAIMNLFKTYLNNLNLNYIQS